MRRVLALVVAVVLCAGCVVDVELVGRACNDAHPCGEGFRCVEGICVDASTLRRCANDNGCAPGERCSDGYCLRAHVDGGEGEGEGEGEADGGPVVDGGIGFDGGLVDGGGVVDGGGLVDGGGGLDAGASDDGGEPRCGTLWSIRDDFENGALMPAWAKELSGASSTIEQADGGLELSLAQAGAFAIARARGIVELDGTDVSVRIDAQPAAGSSGVEASFGVELTDGSWIGFGPLDQNLVVARYAGQESVEVLDPWSSASHRFLRLAFDGLNVELLTSSDGVSWTPRALREGWATSSRGTLFLYGEASGVPSATVHFDDLNHARARAPHCSLALLDDDFEADGIGAEWDVRSQDACSVAVADGVLRATCTAAGWAELASRRVRDFEGAVWIVEVGAAPTPTERGGAYLGVSPTNDSWIELRDREQGAFEVWAYATGTGTVQEIGGPWSSVGGRRRYWRARMTGEGLEFSVSDDLASWTFAGVVTPDVFPHPFTWLMPYAGGWSSQEPLTVEIERVFGEPAP